MSVSLDFDLSGLNTLQTKLEHELSVLMRDAVVAGGNAAVMKARQGRFKDRSGQLRANISSRYLGQKGDWFSVEVKAIMPYASFVNDGTRPHEIWPKAVHGLKGPVRNGQTRRAMGRGPHEYIVGRGIALRWKVNGQEFFASHVNHPGTKQIPFMDDAEDFGRLTMTTYLNRGFAGIAARLETAV
jgi:hypothetical protein